MEECMKVIGKKGNNTAKESSLSKTMFLRVTGSMVNSSPPTDTRNIDLFLKNFYPKILIIIVIFRYLQIHMDVLLFE